MDDEESLEEEQEGVLNVYAYKHTPNTREWPNWDEWNGRETFADWPQENDNHFKKMVKKYGESYVRVEQI